MIKEQIYILGSECLGLISCFGLRTNEAIHLVSQRNNVGKQPFLWLGDSLWCVVRGTKSKNAKRVARSYFCPWPSILQELRISMSSDCSAVMHHTKHRLKNAAEHIDVSLHQIRHWSAISTVDQIMAGHYLTGNALLLLESYARNIGHGSLAMTFQSYAVEVTTTSQKSLKTKDRVEAARLIAALNASDNSIALNRDGEVGSRARRSSMRR